MVAAGGGWGGAPKKVLVCDDDRHIARLLQVNLERFGHHVTCAYDGREAIAKLEQEEFTHAIVDLIMPYFDGWQVLIWIRTHIQTEHMWVGIMTAQMVDMDADFRAKYRYCPDRLIPKPFNPASFSW